jgi:hypothetical protein
MASQIGSSHHLIRVSSLVPWLLVACKDAYRPALPDGGMRAQQQTDFEVAVSPQQQLDLLFMVDNSPSMDPKQEALAKAFPNMLQALETLPGGLPDVHIGVVSSDMGRMDAPGGCSLLGNRGLLWGNDPTVDPNSDNNMYATVKHIKGYAGSSGCGMNSGARWIEDFRVDDPMMRGRNYQGNLTDVFSCLAKAVGTGGCGFESQLQSLRLALNPSGWRYAEPLNPQNAGFLRARAHLAMVLISDEDDCSADTNSEFNDGMFFHRTLGDTASIRCAAHGHVCNGQDIPNYDPATGYAGPEPFVARFADCDAKDDTGPVRDYHKLPLFRVRDMIDSVSQIKERPSDQILAAGVIGWPQEGSLDTTQYRIDKDTTSIPVEQQKLWDYMPICKVPSQKSSDGNIYKAYGGFRLKKFIDAFKNENEANVFSICNPDFSEAMTQIGNAIAERLAPGCIAYPLVDVNPDIPDVQAECRVMRRIPCEDPGQASCASSGYQETMIEQCRNERGSPLDPEAPQPNTVSQEALPCWYLKRDLKVLGCRRSVQGLRPVVLNPGDEILPPGSVLGMQCLTCPDGQPECLL